MSDNRAMRTLKIPLSETSIETLDDLMAQVQLPREELIHLVLEEMLPLVKAGKIPLPPSIQSGRDQHPLQRKLV